MTALTLSTDAQTFAYFLALLAASFVLAGLLWGERGE